ncbi:hypothetical protein C0Q44_02380 [Paenibacillus sp. PCH8]|uniref:collagen-like protein n=1 Tax=Paenibacillus sp. PCH8 TaxID=2066524 RepID=UPI000CF89620|nr:collagen-like protein [Paenibacillus sp. PCH8]PQP83565.1 hypothetical protein C0Q44_02380 [Paenibacillus sp. PCH8]
MSYSEEKKRHKKRNVTVCPSRGKGKERRVKVEKKIAQLKCSPPEVNVKTPTVVGPTGPQGIQGIQGKQGPQGQPVPAGAVGPQGEAGPTGPQGPQGVPGPAGAIRSQGFPGPAGPAGVAGPAGATEATGAAGGVLGFADFFALMPPDNAATVSPGADVSFPQDGPRSGTTITRTGPSTFNLATIGMYLVMFQGSMNEAVQLMLTLNGVDLSNTVVGRVTGTSQMPGVTIVQTTAINSILTVRNPIGNSTALTMTPLAGGTWPVSAHLVITQLA